MERIRNYKYYSLFQNILKFEIFYKMMTLFILSPILRRILQEYLDSVTYGIAFNQDIIYQFLSFKGIVICLFLFILMILIIFYEIYVVMNIIALDKEHKKLSLRKIMLKSFCSLKSLHYPSLPLCGIYIVFLLPLVHIGYLNSYIQRWDIPNFIVGELKLTLGGNVLICLVSIIYYLIFIIMIFVPVYMVFKGKSIISATQESFSLFKKITLKEKGSLLVYLLLWIFIEYMIMNLIPYPILHNRDFNWYFLKYTINSTAFRYSAIQYVLLYFVSIIAMTFFMRYIINLVSRYEDTLMTVDQIPVEIDYLNGWIMKGQNFVREIIYYMKKRLAHFRFYQKHKLFSRCIVGIFIICFMIIYLHQDALVHRPWVIGHRGSGYFVENTYEAIQDANNSQVDYAEIDIQLSKDGIPIVFHDATLSRLSDVNKKVSDLTATELEEITLSQNNHKSNILTLENLIKKMKRDKMAVGLLIELKPTQDNGEDMAHKVIDIIEQYQFSRQSIFMSLDYDSVQVIKKEKPQWWVGYCIYGSVGDIDDSIWEMDIDFLAMEENRASTAFIQKAVRHMIPIYIWTVDNTKKMKQYLDMGVCGLITNYPHLGKLTVEEYEKTHFQYYYYDGKGYPKTTLITGG